MNIHPNPTEFEPPGRSPFLFFCPGNSVHGTSLRVIILLVPPPPPVNTVPSCKLPLPPKYFSGQPPMSQPNYSYPPHPSVRLEAATLFSSRTPQLYRTSPSQLSPPGNQTLHPPSTARGRHLLLPPLLSVTDQDKLCPFPFHTFASTPPRLPKIFYNPASP